MKQQTSHFVAMIHLWSLLSSKTTYTLWALLHSTVMGCSVLSQYLTMLKCFHTLAQQKKIFNFEPSIKTNPAAGVVPTVHILDVYLL